MIKKESIVNKIYYPDSKFYSSEPVYDEIVDRSDFKRVNEDSRISRFSGDIGNAGAGVYDFDGDDFSKGPSNVELALRSGRLDRADIDTLKRTLEKVSSAESEKLTQELEQKSESKRSKARSKALDSALGVNQDSN